MKRMKTYFKYFLAIVIVYIIVDIGSFYALKSTYITKDYTVENSILDVEVTEAKATYLNGYVKGTVKNNTTETINDKYLKIESYSKRDVLLGTKYVKIGSLVSGKETEFSSSFNYEQIDHLYISVIDESELPETSLDFNFDNPDDANISLLVLLGAVILIMF